MIVARRFGAILLLLSGMLLVGCDTDESKRGACDYWFERLIPSLWKIVDRIPLDMNPTADESRCAVVFQYDISKEQNRLVPLGVIIFRKDADQAKDLHAYPLSLPDGSYLGEHKISVSLEDVLSALEGRELVVRDTTAQGMVVQASIFEWKPEGNSEQHYYKSRGWFRFNGKVLVEKDQVTVWELLGGLAARSHLAHRQVFKPRPFDKKSYHPREKEDKPEDLTRLVEPEQAGIVSLAMPTDSSTSHYPEIAVLGFYDSMRDSKRVIDLMVEDAWRRFLGRNGAFDCLADAALDSVMISELDISQAGFVPWHLEPEAKVESGTVVATTVCKIKKDRVTTKTVKFAWTADWQHGKWSADGQWIEGKWLLKMPTIVK